MRRLFSTFAEGLPGVGLLLMRLVVGIALVLHGIPALRTGLASLSGVLELVAIGSGLLLLAGLWTPIAGTLVAILGVWNAIAQPVDPWVSVFLATIGASLALLGPGAWSVDARLFGWKRIEVPPRQG